MSGRESEVRALVIEACHRLVQENLIARTWGNVSARLSVEEFIITPSGRAYETLKPEELVKVKIQDCSREGDQKPSSEKGIHAAVYRLRADVNFVIHTHQFYGTVVGTDRQAGGIPCAGYGLPGTGKLRKQTEKVIRSHPGQKAFLMKRHGALLLGENPGDAFTQAEELENRCRTLVCERIGTGSRTMKSRPKAEKTLTDMLAEKYGAAVSVKNGYLAAYMDLRRKLPAVTDDFAQIIGPEARRSLPMPANVLRALKGRNAVLVKGIGAFCVGKDREDAEAAAMILSKNCAAALYGEGLQPLNFWDSRLQRLVYLKKYSKRK